MRRRALLLLVAVALAIIPASSARASTGSRCTWHGVMTFSPSLPKDSNPMKVKTVVTLVGTLIPGGKDCPLTTGYGMKFQTGHSSGSNCTTFVHKEAFPRGTGAVTYTAPSKSVTSYGAHVDLAGPDPGSKRMYERVQGKGWELTGDLDPTWPTDGSCHTKGLSRLAYSALLYIHFGYSPPAGEAESSR